MTVLHTGATKKYVAGWEHVFGTSGTTKATPGAKKKAAKKKARPGKKAPRSKS